MLKNKTNTSNSKPSIKDLEREKLEYELKQLKKPWYLKPGYLGGVILPFILAGFALLKAWSVGYFDIERKALKTELGQIQDSVIALRTEKLVLQKEYNEYLFWKKALQIKINLLTPEDQIDKLKKGVNSRKVLHNLDSAFSILGPFNEPKLEESLNSCIYNFEKMKEQISGAFLTKEGHHWAELLAFELEILGERIDRGMAGMNLLLPIEQQVGFFIRLPTDFEVEQMGISF